ncbi:predicted protein [Naegleria gruberi]|uniref:Predicted protein n=1 Tax=Naegleria gruberi TaxID=5762 RepID=D2W6G2_NAEGR|nr:uncharacterized protein NAEGRDRAFT_54965 [Naegleria gruberi]EFC35340.1 predicted protein [Naegleria gruberi]|eukprot:XP_002668084.1 predicted protein [Naegleria gruberi strain NEG-M]
MSFSTLERQNELKDLLSPKEESSDSEEFPESQSHSTQNIAPSNVNTHQPKFDFRSTVSNQILASNNNSSDDEDDAKYSVEKTSNNRIFEDVSNTSSVQSPNTEPHNKEEIPTHKVVLPEHQQSYLFNQLKQSYKEEEDLNSPQSSEATSPQPNFEDHTSKSQQQQSIMEEAEKLQTISQFFRKTENTGSNKTKRLSNASIKNVPINTSSTTAQSNNEEEEDFDSWFSNKIN